jgi:hypothetical protein
MLLIEEVESGRLLPIQALREVIELRPASAPPWDDEGLLASLWPRGLQTVSDAEELLWLLDGDVRRTQALRLLDDALSPPHVIGDVPAWLHLCAQTLAHPVSAQLPPSTRVRLMALQGLGDLLVNARHLAQKGDMRWYAGLHDRIERLPRGTRDVLRQYLGYLTLAAPRPVEQLAICSGPVFDATCAQARIRLGTPPLDHSLAARLFQSLYDLERHPSRAQMLQSTVLAPTVPHWPRRDQGRVAELLERESRPSLFGRLVNPRRRGHREQRRPDLSEDFKVWCKKNARAGDSGTLAIPGRSVVARISGWLRLGAE